MSEQTAKAESASTHAWKPGTPWYTTLRFVSAVLATWALSSALKAAAFGSSGFGTTVIDGVHAALSVGALALAVVLVWHALCR